MYERSDTMMHAHARSALLIVLASGALAAAQPCAQWQTAIGSPGAGPVGLSQPAVYAIASHGGQIYAGGSFATMGGQTVNRTARFDGAGWNALGDGIAGSTNEVRAIASFNGDLYIGGRFLTAGGVSASRIARWDGELWHPLGSGLTANLNHSLINAWDMLVWDDGAGPALYIAGSFTSANGIPANNIVKWDGTNFSPLGSGLTQNGTPKSMGAFQGHLYVGGNFFQAGGMSIPWLARWNGSAWSAVPGFSATGEVTAIATFNDGSGEALYLYASGWGVYRFDGISLSNISANLPIGFFESYYALATFDDGGGPALYIGGYFSSMGNLARWTGSQWVAAAGGVQGSDQPYISTLFPHDSQLYIGGRFDHVGGNTSNTAQSIAIYGCPPLTCYANCDGSTTPPILNVEDFTCFINEFAAATALPHEQQLTHYANCDSSTTPPVLNVEDFTCFINRFAQGCP
jgi:hypothetical protein